MQKHDKARNPVCENESRLRDVQTLKSLGFVNKNTAANRAERLQVASLQMRGRWSLLNTNDRIPRHEERAQNAPLSSVWWSRRELNSRLTGLPKGFLHAYAAIILRQAPLRPKELAGRNQSAAALPISKQRGRSPPELTPAASRRERGTDEPLKTD